MDQIGQKDLIKGVEISSGEAKVARLKEYERLSALAQKASKAAVNGNAKIERDN